jgi:hypothetical protein
MMIMALAQLGVEGSGQFSVSNWNGYPAGVPQPAGPFQVIEGGEYTAARQEANAVNRSMHRADASLEGKHIHEIHPVKFGGSPTDPKNKIPLTQQIHRQVTAWWNQLMRELKSTRQKP